MGDGRFNWPPGAIALATFLALAGPATAHQFDGKTAHTHDAAVATMQSSSLDNVSNAETATALNAGENYANRNWETAHVGLTQNLLVLK